MKSEYKMIQQAYDIFFMLIYSMFQQVRRHEKGMESLSHVSKKVGFSLKEIQLKEGVSRGM